MSRNGHFEFESLRDGYADIIDSVLSYGELVEVRPGVLTKELIGTSMTFHDITGSMPVGCGRNLTPAIGEYEALGLISGERVDDLLTYIAPQFSDFMDDGKLSGSYGPRMGAQFVMIEHLLRTETASRQAVGGIWRPGSDPYYGHPGRPEVTISKDPPCTVSVQFLIRNDALQSIWTMRSNDCWTGLPYDAFQFASAHATMANVLGIHSGPLHIRQGSLHLYERHFEPAQQVNYTKVDVPSRPLMQFTGDCWQDAAESARATIDAIRKEIGDD